MELQIFNTLGREKQFFKPINVKQVGIYTCGPTVYSKPHIGNMRAYIIANLFRNVIENILGYNVKHIVNITDVGHLTDDADNGEDKLEKSSKKEGKSAYDIAKEYEKIFKDYLNMLDLHFDFFPKATDHIKEQIDMVKILEEKGYTYIIEDDGVYMDTLKVKDYGKLLPKKHLEGLLAGARIENPKKKNITDFALWKFSKKGEKRHMEWASPWGIGFPGWHIECSAMSTKYLGKHFDIHTGGVDHIPVHHTNEIAQTESCYGGNWINYWVHVEFLQLKDDKMSKSKGNTITLDELLEKGVDPMQFKFFIYLAHYRSMQNFSFEDLQGACKNYNNIVSKLKEYDLLKIKDIDKNDLKDNELINYLLDDLDTVKLIAGINKMLSGIIKEKDLSIIKFLDEKVLKLGLFKKISKKEDIPDEIKKLAELRYKAKKERDFILSDNIREKIKKEGYNIIDTSDGYKIEKI